MTPVNGVPGLVKYCVYTTLQPTTVLAVADAWISKTDSTDFAFLRPSGNKSNIPYNVTPVEVGTATWNSGTVPTNQTIILHIADPTECAALYGGTPPTCFVRPNSSCSSGNKTVAYNAIPAGAENCPAPSEAFEAQTTNEFGDEVGLAANGNELVSLSVEFASYACSVKGHWNLGQTDPCDTDPSAAPFTMAAATNLIKAKIYAVETDAGTCSPLYQLRVRAMCSQRLRPRTSPSLTGRRRTRRSARVM